MAIKRKKSGSGGANWMDTYGDMVTLLLCFFVLLYSMSTISEDKWKAIVLSFNPNARPTQTEIISGNQNGPSADDDLEGNIPMTEEEIKAAAQEEIDQAIEALYQAMKSYAAQSEDGKNISVTKGDGYVFVSFNDAVFFDGDSYVLRKDGERVLTAVSEIMSKAEKYIDEVVVMGHTAQGNPGKANTVKVDRFLSSNRATIVTVFIQEHSTLSGARLISQGNGQWRNVADNDTAANRAKNRRVEIMITGKDLYNELGDSIEQYESIRTGEANLQASRQEAGSSD